MDEELRRMLNIKDDVKNEYIPGSEAPQIEVPQPKPEIKTEPETKKQTAPKTDRKAPSYRFSSACAIIGIVVLALGAFFLLTREVAIQKQMDDIVELSNKIEHLYSERDALSAQYNGSVDIGTIRERASEIGMHEADDSQIVNLD